MPEAVFGAAQFFDPVQVQLQEWSADFVALVLWSRVENTGGIFGYLHRGQIRLLSRGNKLEFRGRGGEITQRAKVLAVQTWPPEFSPWNLCKGE